MHYTESGTGLPALLLHAFPLDSRMWDGVRARLSRHLRLIAPDQRGFGRSPLAADGAEPSLEAAATDVVALLDELGVDRVVLGGCSMGGYLAMAVLRQAPERVAGLIFSDTRADADRPAQRADRFAKIERAKRDGIAGWLADSMIPGLLGETTRARRPAVVERVRALTEEQSAAGVAWALRAMATRPDSSELLSASALPTLVLVGEEDTITPPEASARIAELSGDSTFVRLPGCGHLAALEAPDTFADAVIGWLPALDH